MLIRFRRLVLALGAGTSLLAAAPSATAQQFWLTTRDFPGGPKTTLTTVGDSTLLTNVASGVLHSPNGGRSWTLTLPAHGITCFGHASGGQVLAGGVGKLYLSTDTGLHWDSVTVPTAYPINAALVTTAGEWLVATGTLDVIDGFVGDGVLASSDSGRTWQPRRQGMPGSGFVERLVQDRQGQLYAAQTDENGAGGLYTSSDDGRHWQRVPFQIDGRGVVADDVTPERITALTITPTDSLVCSFSGVAVNVLVQLNLIKALPDVGNLQRWRVLRLGFAGAWWLEPLLQNLYIARNGDWYSARRGSIASGGTLRSTDHGRTWQRITYGLGLDLSGNFGPQTCAEAGNGRLYMVQQLDERVYWTDASRITGLNDDDATAIRFELWPNPTAQLLRLRWAATTNAPAFTLTDLMGRAVAVPCTSLATEATLDLSGIAGGTYLLHGRAAGRTWVRRVVRQ